MKIEKRKLSDLKPAEYNPRKALTPADPEYQKIKRSIETFGYVDPMIINSDGTIIGGHQRHTVLSDLGYSEAECVVLDLNKEDEKALNVAMNKISGEWDTNKLKDLLMDLDLGDYDLSLTGFDSKELGDLIDLSGFEPEVTEDEFKPEEVEELSFVNSGDVWQLGRHRLMCGDSTSEADVKRLMGDEKMDLIITDPPYNVAYEDKQKKMDAFRTNSNGSMKIQNDSMKQDQFYMFLLKAFGNMGSLHERWCCHLCFPCRY